MSAVRLADIVQSITVNTSAVRLADTVPGGMLFESYFISVTNTEEYMTFDCDPDGTCCCLIFDFLGVVREVIRCPYTAGVESDVYAGALRETLFSFLNFIGLAHTSTDRVVLELVSFVLDFVVNRHSCPLDGPRRVPVAYISVIAILDEGSVRETGRVRATRESVEALSVVRADELEARYVSCVICLEEFRHDHDQNQKLEEFRHDHDHDQNQELEEFRRDHDQNQELEEFRHDHDHDHDQNQELEEFRHDHDQNQELEEFRHDHNQNQELEEFRHDHDQNQECDMKIARMPCGHVFHRDCVAKWLNNSHVCPLCRFEMPKELMQISNRAN